MFLHTNFLAKSDIQSCQLLPLAIHRQQLSMFPAKLTAMPLVS
jgi:hypothetical protein